MVNGWEVIKSFVLRHKATGREISPYGTLPFGTYDDWERVEKGWTLRNLNTNQIGLCRAPFTTCEEAEQYAATHVAPRSGYGD